MVSPDLWLSFLTRLSSEDQTDRTNIGIYASCVTAAVILATIRAYMFFQVVLRSSESLHNDMVTALLKAPVLFFDSNPIGRILNRFSKDIGCMDEVLPKTFLFAVQLVLFVLTAGNFWLLIKEVCIMKVLVAFCTYLSLCFLREYLTIWKENSYHGQLQWVINSQLGQEPKVVFTFISNIHPLMFLLHSCNSQTL